MITLPEFEEERMALMAEEHDILVDLVDHMHALSVGWINLRRPTKPWPLRNKAHVERSIIYNGDAPVSQPSLFMTDCSWYLAVWVVLLTGLDRYLASNDVVLFLSTYPAEIFFGDWVTVLGDFVVHQIGKAAPVFKPGVYAHSDRSIHVGITSVMAFVALQRQHRTMSSVYGVLAVLVSSIWWCCWRASRLITE